MNIAIFTDEKGLSSEIINAEHLSIFTKSANQWQLKKTFEISTKSKETLALLRSRLEELIDMIESCEIVVAKKMLGAAYNIFDRAGYQIWELDGSPSKLLPPLEQKIIIQRYDLTADDDPFSFYEDMGDGRYAIDIKQILFNNPHITSKKLLLPFLDHRDFYELEVIFSHLPPWLEGGLKKRGLTKELTDHQIDEHKIIIRRATCKDSIG